MHHHSIMLCCKQCGKTSNDSPSQAKRNSQFCSADCYRAWKIAQGKTPVPHICELCGKEFMARKNENRQYCSNECQGKVRRKRETRNCAYCNKGFSCHPCSTKKFCSRNCQGAAIGFQHRGLDYPKRTCEHCGNEFEIRRKGLSGRFCSHACLYAGVNRVPRVTVQCELCGKLKEIIPSALKKFRFCSAKCRATFTMQMVPRISSLEYKMKEAFEQANMHPEAQYRVGAYWLDFAFPEQRLAVECDGNYWHSREDKKVKDRQKDGFLKSQCWHVLRLSETDINLSPTECVKRVQAKLQHLTSLVS